MEQLTKNQAVATSQEAVQNQNEPQLRDENAHNDKSVQDRKSGSAGMPRPISYAVFCLKKKKEDDERQRKQNNKQSYHVIEEYFRDGVYDDGGRRQSRRFRSQKNPCVLFFFFNDTATTEIYTLSLHDALPI